MLLRAWSDGDGGARDRVLGLVHDELLVLARSRFRHERPGHTLQATALVSELYLKLVDQRRVRWRDRLHFYAAAATIMRRLLVDHARVRDARKRGVDWRRVTLPELAGGGADPIDLVALDVALDKLRALDPRGATVVELRFFAGLEVVEVAAMLGVSAPTVKREWAAAKAWLWAELAGTRPLAEAPGDGAPGPTRDTGR